MAAHTQRASGMVTSRDRMAGLSLFAPLPFVLDEVPEWADPSQVFKLRAEWQGVELSRRGALAPTLTRRARPASSAAAELGFILGECASMGASVLTAIAGAGHLMYIAGE